MWWGDEQYLMVEQRKKSRFYIKDRVYFLHLLIYLIFQIFRAFMKFFFIKYNFEISSVRGPGHYQKREARTYRSVHRSILERIECVLALRACRVARNIKRRGLTRLHWPFCDFGHYPDSKKAQRAMRNSFAEGERVLYQNNIIF